MLRRLLNKLHEDNHPFIGGFVEGYVTTSAVIYTGLIILIRIGGKV